jgi:hypothetical protein
MQTKGGPSRPQGDIMSAYIVEDSTIDRIVTHILGYQDCNIRGLLPGVLEYAGADELGRELLALNTRSVNARYHGTAAAPEYHHTKRTCEPLQLLKTLACFLYQSCEGDCDHDPLYVALEQIQLRVAMVLIYSRVPEYAKTEGDDGLPTLTIRENGKVIAFYRGSSLVSGIHD